MPEVGISVCLSVCLVCLSVCLWLNLKRSLSFYLGCCGFYMMKRKSMCFDLILRTKSKNKNKLKKDRSSSVFCSIWNEKFLCRAPVSCFLFVLLFFFRLCTLNVFQKLHPACNPQRKSDQDWIQTQMGFSRGDVFLLFLRTKLIVFFWSMNFSTDEKRDTERVREFLFNFPHNSVFHTSSESHFFRFSSNYPSSVKVLTSDSNRLCAFEKRVLVLCWSRVPSLSTLIFDHLCAYLLLYACPFHNCKSSELQSLAYSLQLNWKLLLYSGFCVVRSINQNDRICSSLVRYSVESNWTSNAQVP
jgi:hypothetical protein